MLSTAQCVARQIVARLANKEGDISIMRVKSQPSFGYTFAPRLLITMQPRAVLIADDCKSIDVLNAIDAIDAWLCRSGDANDDTTAVVTSALIVVLMATCSDDDRWTQRGATLSMCANRSVET